MGFPFRSEKLIKYLTGRYQLGGVLPNDGYIVGVAKHIHQDNVQALGGAGSLVTMQTYTLPAPSLKNDNDFLDVLYGGEFAANNNSKNITIRAGGVVVHSFGLFPINGTDWAYKIRYVRTSSTNLRAIALALPVSIALNAATAALTGSGVVFALFNPTITVADLNNNSCVFDVQGQGTNTTDVAHRHTSIELTRNS